jgi:DNA-binding transcriptional LysR family regulator
VLKSSLRYFISVAQHGSIRAAADALHVAQSAVSRQIQALEAELGTTLLERRARGVALTQSGEVLFRFARETTFNVERVRSEIDALHGLRRGHVRLIVIESLLSQVVPQAIEKFRAKHAGVTFEVTSAGSNQVVQSVRAAEQDIGIAFNQAASADLSVAFGLREPIYAVMTPTHPLARQASLSIARVAGWPVGLSMPGSGTRQLVDAACLEAAVRMAPVLQTNSIDLLHRFALSGQGVSFLARLNCLDSIRAGRLVTRRLSEAILAGGMIEILTLAERRLPLAAEEFVVYLRRELQALPSHGASGRPAPMPKRQR